MSLHATHTKRLGDRLEEFVQANRGIMWTLWGVALGNVGGQGGGVPGAVTLPALPGAGPPCPVQRPERSPAHLSKLAPAHTQASA